MPLNRQPRRSRRTASLGLLALLTIMACSSDDDEPTIPDPGGNNDVVIHLTTANRFSPSDVSVDVGTTVRWVNDASVAHTVTPTDPAQAGVWASAGTSTPGNVLSHTFNTAGRTYTYFCQPHQAAGMTGVVRVR